MAKLPSFGRLMYSVNKT